MSTLALRSGQPVAASENLVEFLQDAIDQARRDTESLEPAHEGRLHRLHLQLLTRNAHYADLVRQRLCWVPPDSAGPDPAICETCRVAVLSPEDSALPPPPAWGEPSFHPRQFEQQLAGSSLRATFFHDLRTWQIYDHRRRFGLLWLTGPRNYCPWEPAAPLRTILHWSYQLQGLRLIHAGTLGKRGAGILLAGKGGSGKSGTVAGGIAHGLDSVGDDYVLVEETPSGVHAYPLFRTLKQDRAGVRRLGLEKLIGCDRAPNWQDKFEFTSEEIGGRGLANRLTIRAIVIPRISGAAPPGNSAAAPGNTAAGFAIRPTSRQRAMLALAPSGVFQLPGERDAGARLFAALVRRLPCFELALSPDPGDVSRTVESFLEGGLPCD